MITPYTCIMLPGQPSWWPAKMPGAVLDYTLDITSVVDPTTDFPVSVSAAIAPSGTGEMQPSALSVNGYALTLTETSGQPTRVYSVLFTVTMSDGRTYPFVVNQGVLPILPTDVAPPSPSPGFGTPIVWNYAAGFDFTHVLNSGYIALLGGL